MSREVHVRICGGRRVRLPPPTRHCFVCHPRRLGNLDADVDLGYLSRIEPEIEGRGVEPPGFLLGQAEDLQVAVSCSLLGPALLGRLSRTPGVVEGDARTCQADGSRADDRCKSDCVHGAQCRSWSPSGLNVC
jgi:hypothetical protein